MRLIFSFVITLLLTQPQLSPPVQAAEPVPKKQAATTNDNRSLRAVAKATGDSRYRIALVIGNSNYVSSPLKNPSNDARVIAATLRRLGFDVAERTDLNYAAMNEAIDSFGDKLKPGGVALFYYAGHGMQVNGNNYLIPIDAKINTENEIRYKSVDAGLVLAKMEAARSDVNIAIMDACRDNPFARSFRSGTKGLAQVDAPTGTIIAFATAPGRTASDGEGKNGVYTAALVQALEMPGLKVEEVFKQVRRLVVDKTNKAQTPWESSSLIGDFHFASPSNAAKEQSTPSRPMPIASTIIQPANASPTQEWEPKISFDGRVGKIKLNNDSNYPVNITLWHPDTRSKFASWTVPAKSTRFLDSNNSNINVGGDWGVQIGTGPVRTLSKASHWSTYWAVTPETYAGSTGH